MNSRKSNNRICSSSNSSNNSSSFHVCFVFVLLSLTLLTERISCFTTSTTTHTTTMTKTNNRIQWNDFHNLAILSASTSASSSSEITDWDKINKKQEQFKNSKNNNNPNPNSNNNNNYSMNRDDPEWKFFDTARINVKGGDGGNGCVAFRREKGVAMGGPSGGRGGNGGDVYIICDEAFNTLAPCRNRVHVRATNGINGQGKSRNGMIGTDQYVTVPPGTVVRELTTDKVAGELKVHGETLLVARGGRGGRGNAAFKTQRYTAPKIAERGEPGATRWISLELKLVADVGFLGKPNAGKSTLLAASSNAKPKIANYPFTTIVPNLGVCDLSNSGDGSGGQGLVLCDIPGLIEGASSGVGLGYAFLRHVQRCKVLLHVVDGTSDDPIGDFNTINQELKKYDDFLATKPQVVVLNKIDVSEVNEKQDELIAKLKEAAGHSRVLPISAATTKNVQELMGRLKKFVDTQPEAELPEPPQVDFSKAGLDGDSDDFGTYLMFHAFFNVVVIVFMITSFMFAHAPTFVVNQQFFFT